MQRTTVVIPCYNEERRLEPASIDLLIEDDAIDVLLVDDGSTDGTRELLSRLAAARPGQLRVLELAQNGGKAEAVRRGLADVVEAGASGGRRRADRDQPFVRSNSRMKSTSASTPASGNAL